MPVASFDIGAALVAGALGTIAMTAFWLASTASGVSRLDWPRLLGTWFFPPGPVATAVGLAWHVASGLLYGLVYAWVLTEASIAPTAASGAVLGLVHAAVALMWLIPIARFHPVHRASSLESVWRGRDVAAYALGYPIFGLVFGAAYQRAPGWGTVAGMDPVRFWLAAALVAAGIGLLWLAARPIALARGPAFASAEPSLAERRAAIDAALSAGRMSAEDHALAIAELEENPPVV